MTQCKRGVGYVIPRPGVTPRATCRDITPDTLFSHPRPCWITTPHLATFWSERIFHTICFVIKRFPGMFDHYLAASLPFFEREGCGRCGAVALTGHLAGRASRRRSKHDPAAELGRFHGGTRGAAGDDGVSQRHPAALADHVWRPTLLCNPGDDLFAG
ncbi:hypothetical protein BO94DRAFT_540002 [Aspergillus sclerotioniger CBS 115572]|uniref:Uncharacterized protein n=1 Tax=Aspergillus sclerotioniger CBS 115572 TaxID=1450535 RepID=A0A317VCR9_9EURO|nr:hypothetical protein BO94DRAFT_540002 [Aspergillus sclerotioniger CBS 115572]PWY69670.1 hypothetical protein BO94DRAFT_540002 [Aspergillus sclerotioniger CBS 115572]